MGEGDQLEGEFHSRATLRGFGYMTMGVSVMTGGLLWSKASEKVKEHGAMDGTLGGAAIVIGVGGALAGLIMALTPDSVEVQVTPAAFASGERKSQPTAWADDWVPRGVVASGSF